MPRGNAPRQPSRTGRQEGAGRASSKSDPAKGRRNTAAKPIKTALGKKNDPVRPGALVKRAGVYDPISSPRVRAIIAGLDKLYPDVTCALYHRNAWELVVATILSAQCTDVRVNLVTPGLFEKYPTVQDFAALEPEQLEPDIRSTGFFRNKSKSVVGAARKVVADFGGIVPQTMDELLTLPGVARKTANVVLGTWFKKNEGVVVDTHVQRLSQRLGWTKNTDPEKIEIDLCAILPREEWDHTSHVLIFHGRRCCYARKPDCSACSVNDTCPAAFDAENVGRKASRPRGAVETAPPARRSEGKPETRGKPSTKRKTPKRAS